MKKLIQFLSLGLLDNYKCYRAWIGGKWMQAHFDSPVNACLWVSIPDWADKNYKIGLQRGVPNFEFYE